MYDWYQHFKSAFTPEECQAVIDYGLQFPAKEGEVGHGGKQVIDPMRESLVRWLPRDDINLQFLFNRIVLRCLKVNKTTFKFDLSNEPDLSFGSAQFTEYHSVNGGHYDWHEDNSWVPRIHTEEDRKISCIIQLSPKEHYKGGKLELEATTMGESQFIDQGDMIFIPSFLRHRVTPVTEGTRYSLVVWFYGPRFR